VVGAGDLTLLPAFADSHEHLMEASRNMLLVPFDKARSVAEFTGMVSEASPPRRARRAEFDIDRLAQVEPGREPAPDLGRTGRGGTGSSGAGPPGLPPGGGQFGRAAAADIGADTPDPPGGKTGRLADGSLNGVLEGGAVDQVAGFAPAPGGTELAVALRTGPAAYAAAGSALFAKR
jgi:predicted amidohydrolase YtcJ